MYSSARRSSSSIETPGPSSSPIIASVSATMSPARAMPSISAWDLRIIIGSSNGDLLERSLDLGENLVRRAVSVDRDEDAQGAVVLDQRLRLAVIELQPGADRLRRVVRAPLFPGALEQPLDADLVRDLEREDDRQLAADLPQHRVERIGLGRRSRKAAEDEALGGS